MLAGAGASFGCEGAVDLLGQRPPLGDQLFPRMCQVSENWRQQPQEPFQRGFEEGMKAILDTLDGRSVWPLWRDVARYIWTIWGRSETTYMQLLRILSKVEDLSLTLSTLNYDLLLEQGLEACALPYHYGGLLGSPPESIPLFKLHGSVNWVSNMTVQVGQASAVPFSGGGLQLVCSLSEFESSLKRNELGAILSIYEPGKRTLNEPRFVEAVQESWRQELSTAQMLVCVGVRPMAHDRHIWEPIRSSRAPLIVIGADPSEEHLWGGIRDLRSVRFIGSKFASSLPLLKDALRTLERGGKL